MLGVIWDGLMRYLISILAFPRCDMLCHDMHEFGLHWTAVRWWNNNILNICDASNTHKSEDWPFLNPGILTKKVYNDS